MTIVCQHSKRSEGFIFISMEYICTLCVFVLSFLTDCWKLAKAPFSRFVFSAFVCITIVGPRLSAHNWLQLYGFILTGCDFHRTTSGISSLATYIYSMSNFASSHICVFSDDILERTFGLTIDDAVIIQTKLLID